MVGAYYRGVVPSRASIAPTSDSLGHVVHSNPLYRVDLEWDASDKARGQAESAILITLCGPAAERKKYGSTRGAGADNDIATDLALHINGNSEQATAYLKWMKIRARDLVALRWREIEAVAAALVEKKTLSREDIRDTINSALGLKPIVINTPQASRRAARRS